MRTCRLLWSSIDNDDSQDLDQIEVAEEADDGTIRIQVAIADVDETVRQGGAIDTHAAHNTTSVYTGVTVFTMLPQALSYDATSLKQDADRLAVVIAFRVKADGTLGEERVFRALARNKAKLAYPGLADWLAGKAAVPERVERARAPETARAPGPRHRRPPGTAGGAGRAGLGDAGGESSSGPWPGWWTSSSTSTAARASSSKT